jgi:hypothetical protein|tara:strand:- start:1438 stop:1845 length:408 start_codon:yes stop_codon:yes gene_type:complete
LCALADATSVSNIEPVFPVAVSLSNTTVDVVAVVLNVVVVLLLVDVSLVVEKVVLKLVVVLLLVEKVVVVLKVVVVDLLVEKVVVVLNEVVVDRLVLKLTAVLKEVVVFLEVFLEPPPLPGRFVLKVVEVDLLVP